MAYDKSGGVLFKNDRRSSEKQPVMQGDLEIIKSDLKLLIEDAKAGRPAKLRIAAFQRTSRTNKNFLSIAVQHFGSWEQERDTKKQQQSGGGGGEPWSDSGDAGGDEPWNSSGGADGGDGNSFNDDIPF